jgi:hypothetical protein
MILFGLGWGFFDCNNMPILCQITRAEYRATGYGFMNLVSISIGAGRDGGPGLDARPWGRFFRRFCGRRAAGAVERRPDFAVETAPGFNGNELR